MMAQERKETMEALLRFDGKTVVITGGTGGIGTEVVARFYQQGAHVVVADIRRDVDNIIKKFRDRNVDISYVQTDVTDPNSVRAGATLVRIEVLADTAENTLSVTIADNGCGMSEEQLAKVEDPFFTTRNTRKVGLGIPFFKQAALATGGSFSIRSKEGEGTVTKAVFVLDSIDRMLL